ncbi:hypothetical protein KJ980_08755 [Patescibacteria group bacterium]|nr:hypothetical protein [Patescibacteria group bacterium]
MKILKIKKGFITNSSGSYEWIPPQENNPSGDNSQPAQPVQPTQPLSPAASSPAISKSYSAQSNSDAGVKGSGLDPSIMLFGAFFIVVVIIAIVAEIAGKIRRKIKNVKKN